MCAGWLGCEVRSVYFLFDGQMFVCKHSSCSRWDFKWICQLPKRKMCTSAFNRWFINTDCVWHLFWLTGSSHVLFWTLTSVYYMHSMKSFIRDFFSVFHAVSVPLWFLSFQGIFLCIVLFVGVFKHSDCDVSAGMVECVWSTGRSMWPSAPIAPLCCLKCANPFTLFSPSTKGPPRALCSWLNPYLALTPIGPPALSCLHPDPDPFPIFPPLPSIFTWCPRCPLSVLICVCACGCPIILRSSGSFNLFHFLPLPLTS